MQIVAAVDSIVNRGNRKIDLERLFEPGQLDNIIFSVLVFIVTAHEFCCFCLYRLLVRQLLAGLLVDRGLTPTVICESAGCQAEDAMIYRDIYYKLLSLNTKNRE